MGDDEKANVREVHRVTRIRIRHVQSWLKQLLRKHGVSANRLILTGFSQGAVLAVLCATRMGALGAIACGGVTTELVYSQQKDDYVGDQWMQWEELLPKSDPGTRFCAVNGTADPYVPRKHLERMLRNFECQWHWDRGV